MTEARFGNAGARRVSPQDLCGMVIAGGPNGEPLACAYAPGHQSEHSWATLPTLTQRPRDPRERMQSRNVRERARARGEDPNQQPMSHVGPMGYAE